MKTIECYLLALAAATAMIAPVSAQNAERQATLTGGGEANGTGKCTIEVYVDGAADVEIRGGRGVLRTRSGQPAQWRRFECSGPMPTNSAQIEFQGVDGRGRQELIQDSRNGSGAIIVRIQDRDGGAEGYTFDLMWRGAGFGPGPGPTGQSSRGVFQENAPNQAARTCEDAVTQRANQQYGLRDVNFRRLNADDNPGRNDTILGSFDARRGNSRETYRFSCSVNLQTGRVRSVEISEGRGSATADPYIGGNNSMLACQRAAERRIHQDGYRNVQFGWPDAGGSRNGRMVGTAVAQRGDNGRAYDFDIRCNVDLASGDVRSVRATRR